MSAPPPPHTTPHRPPPPSIRTLEEVVGGEVDGAGSRRALQRSEVDVEDTVGGLAALRDVQQEVPDVRQYMTRRAAGLATPPILQTWRCPCGGNGPAQPGARVRHPASPPSCPPPTCRRRSPPRCSCGWGGQAWQTRLRPRTGGAPPHGSTAAAGGRGGGGEGRGRAEGRGD